MLRISIFIAILFCCDLFLGCKPKNGSEQVDQLLVNEKTAIVRNGLELVPALKNLDSIRVFFYLHPFTDGAEQYTRYYTTQVSSANTLLSGVHNALKQPFVEDTLRNCRSEGKMYCYSQGKVAQVIYFTRQHQSCEHFYIIHVGRYYYFPFPDDLAQALAGVKATIEPLE